MKENQETKLFFIISLPRSGSTVLTAEIDRFDEVVSLPESYFPLMMEFISDIEQLKPSDLARIFLQSCDAGFTLTEEELAGLIQPGNLRKSLIDIGLACAKKSGRQADGIKAVVWKSTRVLSGLEAVAPYCDGLILLERNPENVFESQFRVGFGVNNRNAFRFAAFKQSYEALFKHLSHGKVFRMQYEEIPVSLLDLMQWMGVSNRMRRGGESTMAATVAQCEWHAGLLDGFQSKDEEKRRALGITQRILFRLANALCLLMRPYLLRVRKRRDESIAMRIRQEGLVGSELTLDETK